MSNRALGAFKWQAEQSCTTISFLPSANDDGGALVAIAQAVVCTTAN